LAGDEAIKRTVALGSDHAGFGLKEELKRSLEAMGYSVLDVGTDSEESCDYPDFARAVAEAVADGTAFRGVLVCGTGVGMSMVANKVPGIRAAVCNDEYCARYSRLHNDANVITVGARVLSLDDARRVLSVFMRTGFEGDGPDGERHVKRLEKLQAVEKEYGCGGGR